MIPAMTSDAERACYYRLVAERGEGAVIELGAWLGASTAWIAAALRDTGGGVAQVYDKFLARPAHAAKASSFCEKHGIAQAPVPIGSLLGQFKKNLGPLMAHVKARQGEISRIKWGDDRIAVLIADAPKRVPQISAVLTRLRGGLQPGSIMAWQDFCHFPSYEIPACLYRLRDHLEFVEAVVPGTTMVFQVTSQWDADEVSPEALAVSRWTPSEIYAAWDFWLEGWVQPQKADLFNCGRAMFLCDIGEDELAVEVLDRVYRTGSAAIVPKWQYLQRQRDNMVARYRPLFAYLEAQGAL